MSEELERPDEETLATTTFLLRLHGAGERGAFTALYERHAPRVARGIAARLGIPLRRLQDVEDLLQETFLAAWQRMERGSLDDFTTPGGFRGLLVRIALQRTTDAMRHAWRERRDVRREEAWEEDRVEVRTDSPSEFAIAHELERRHEEALLGLAEEDRWILDCRDNLGMSYEEIARERGMRPANAKLRLHRARARLRAAIDRRTNGT